MDRKKKIILISSIGVVTLIIILLLILFFVTDMFKSPQQLFYKYLPQNSQIVEVLSSDLSMIHAQKKAQNSYTTTGEITLTYETDNEDNQSETENAVELFKIITEGKKDSQNQKQYHKMALTKNNQELLELKYLRNQDLYALSSNQIVTKYVAVENNNLKELATKLGYQNVDQIPDKIEGINTTNFLQIPETEKNTILKNYGTLIAKNIPKNKFSKASNVDIAVDGENYKTKQYTLTLTTEEIKEIGIQVLEYLQTDTQTLTMLLNQYQTIASNDELTTTTLIKNIQTLEENLKQAQIENETIQISLCIAGDKLVTTQIKAQDEKVDIQYVNGARENKVIIQSDFNMVGEYNWIELKKTEDTDQYTLSVTVTNTSNTKDGITLQMSKVGNSSSSTIRTLDILTIKTEGDTYTFKYSDNVAIENEVTIDNLTAENAITINSYSQEELQQLLSAIVERTTQVVQETITKVMTVNQDSSFNNMSEGTTGPQEQMTEENNVSDATQTTLSETEKLAIEMYNEQFVAYLGESVSADQVKQLLTVCKTAIQNQNTITVKYSGTYNNTQIEKEVKTVQELDELSNYVVSGKNYKAQGLADTTGKLSEVTIMEIKK